MEEGRGEGMEEGREVTRAQQEQQHIFLATMEGAV